MYFFLRKANGNAFCYTLATKQQIKMKTCRGYTFLKVAMATPLNKYIAHISQTIKTIDLIERLIT